MKPHMILLKPAFKYPSKGSFTKDKTHTLLTYAGSNQLKTEVYKALLGQNNFNCVSK